MKHVSDVVIIGGGIIGLTSAYYLSRQGMKVTVLEANEVGSGSSGGNAGLLVPSHFIPLAAPGVIGKTLRDMLKPDSPFYIKPRLDFRFLSWLWRFSRSCTASHVQRSAGILRDLSFASVELFEDIIDNERLDCGLQRNGLLMVFNDEKSGEECREMVTDADKIGMEAKLLGREETGLMEPSVNGSVLGSAFFPGDAHLNPGLFVQRLAETLTYQGVEIIENSPVEKIETDNSRLTCVRCGEKDYYGRHFVLAGGAWSPHLAKQLKLNIPVQPAKGYSITVENVPNKGEIPLILEGAKVAVTPLGTQLRLAGTLEMAGLDTTINPRRVQAIRDAIPTYLDIHIPEQVPGEVWGGMRPVTPDGLPIIDTRVKYENLTIATGHAMIGISLAAVSGKIVGDLIAGTNPGFDLSPLKYSRF
jgi:D-amino-acid dehydrogenase